VGRNRDRRIATARTPSDARCGRCRRGLRGTRACGS
jgi:hypothetical protein